MMLQNKVRAQINPNALQQPGSATQADGLGD